MAAGLASLFGATAWADDFYKGKELTLIISSGTGGGYDAYGRLIGKHLVNHLPASRCSSRAICRVPAAAAATATSTTWRPRTAR
jgi:hypothetical protein